MGRYQAVDSSDTTGSRQSGPKALPVEAFGYATAPAKEIIQSRPWYILINGQSAAAYTFLYQTTCSIGGTSVAVSGGLAPGGEVYTTGSDLQAAGNAPVKLDIGPVAWAGGGGAVGEITFVYRGGL